MAKHLLKDVHIRSAKPDTAKPYRLPDGAGLYLYVPPSGVKSWQFRYKLDGKHQTATLGKVTPVQGLKWARVAADEARSRAQQGQNVTIQQRITKARRVAAGKGIFASISAEWVKRQARDQKWTAAYKAEVEASLRNHLRELDKLPLSEIDAAIATPLIERVERRAPDMARKVEQRLHGILDYGVRRGLIRLNPLPRPERRRRKDRKHFPAVTKREALGEILRRADQLQMVSKGVRRAHLLTVFTCQRIGEIVPAMWSEFDLEKGHWEIPRERMKRKDAERGPHVIPIPPRLLHEIRDWRRSDGDKAVYVCPAPTGDSHVTREAVEKFYRRGLGLAGVHSPHSWRSVFSTWARDAGKDADVVEAQLDHVIGSKVAASYDRAMRIDLRRELMAWYESALIAARDGADVIQLPAKAG